MAVISNNTEFQKRVIRGVSTVCMFQSKISKRELDKVADLSKGYDTRVPVEIWDPKDWSLHGNEAEVVLQILRIVMLRRWRTNAT